MFEQAVAVSEAIRQAPCTPLIPALCGCVACGTVEMIAGAPLRSCEGCGEPYTPLPAPVLSPIDPGSRPSLKHSM